MSEAELARLKRDERAMWAKGDYATIARDLFWEVGAHIVDRVGVAPGDVVLDVACGTGNAAIRAAEAGGDVVGLDLTPELLDAGRTLAAAAGVHVDWVEGDAEALPFDDESFDIVVSVFGVMFAPRHEIAAAELDRVLRSEGRLGLCSWTPGSSIADLMRTMFAHLPPAAGFAQPPPLWGTEAHVQALFEGSGIELRFEHAQLELRAESIEHALATYESKWGPFMGRRTCSSVRAAGASSGRIFRALWSATTPALGTHSRIRRSTWWSWARRADGRHDSGVRADEFPPRRRSNRQPRERTRNRSERKDEAHANDHAMPVVRHRG